MYVTFCDTCFRGEKRTVKTPMWAVRKLQNAQTCSKGTNNDKGGLQDDDKKVFPNNAVIACVSLNHTIKMTLVPCEKFK